MQPKPYLTNLTALRGIAALLVVVFHANEVVAPWVKTEDTWFLDKLYLMVDLFFVLSGFVMAYVYQEEFARGITRASLRSFLAARFARVYPLHFASLAALVLIIGMYWLQGKPEYRDGYIRALHEFKDLPAQLLLVQSMGGIALFSWNVPSWSISAEWWAYLLFPVLMVWIPQWNWAGRLLLAGLIMATYLVLEYYVAPLTRARFDFMQPKITLDMTWDFGFARGLLGFALGTLVYQAYRMSWGREVLSKGASLLILTLAWAALTHFAVSDSVAVWLFPFVVLSAAYGGPALNRFFTLGPLQRLGDWSYSIYMWHWVLLTLGVTIRNLSSATPPIDGPAGGNFFGVSRPPALWLGYLVITIAIGAASYRWLEVPARIWLRRILSGRRKEPTKVF